MRWYKARRLLLERYPHVSNLVHKKVEFVTLFLGTTLGLVLVAMVLRLYFEGIATFSILRLGCFTLGLILSLGLLISGFLSTSINLALALVLVNVAIILPEDVSRLFFVQAMYGMIGFSIIFHKRYQLLITLVGFPGLVLIKTIFEEVQRFNGIATRSTLEPTLLSLLFIVGLIPVILYITSILDRELQQNNQLNRKNKELQNSAYNDPLTGAANRRFGERVLDHELQRCQRTNEPLCLVFLDLDNFKTCNDTYGHAAGDEVLVAYSKLFRDNIRRSDMIIRWGGDEFVLVCPGATKEVVKTLCTKLCALLYASPVFGTYHVGVSAGLIHAEPGDSVATCVARADIQLYRAKAAGRGCIISDDIP